MNQVAKERSISSGAMNDEAIERRDSVGKSLRDNFFKEFQKVNESMRRSSQGGLGAWVTFDKSQKLRKRSYS